MKNGISMSSKVNEKLATLQGQFQTLTFETLKKDTEINNLKLALQNKDNANNSIIEQKNNEINSVSAKQSSFMNQKTIELSGKDNEIKALQSEIGIYKTSLSSAQKELNQKNNIIDLISKNVEDLRLEKTELKDSNKVLNNLLLKNAEQLKEKDLEISILKQMGHELSESHIHGEQISDLINNNQTTQSIYPSENLEQLEIELSGNSFSEVDNNVDI